MYAFADDRGAREVGPAMIETGRLVSKPGVLAFTALCSAPEEGLHAAQPFIRGLLNCPARIRRRLAVRLCDDIADAGGSDYRTWRGVAGKGGGVPI
jgi:hypothetical protein